MKTNKGAFIVRLLLLTFLLPSFPVLSQENTKEIEVLVLTNTKKNKTYQIKSAKRVKIWIEGDIKLKGRLNDILNDSIVIGEQIVGLSRIKKIRINSTGAKIVGGTFMGGGLIITGLGIGIVATASSASGCLGPAIATAMGVLVIGMGGVVTLIALPILLIGKKFNIEKNWTISTALVAE